MKKKYFLQVVVVTVFLCFNAAALAGGVINSAETETGSFTSPTYQDAWTFSGSAGDRVVITATGTTPGVYPEIYLNPPGSGESEASAVGAGGFKRLDYQLQQTGTYTILMQDNGLNTAGDYAISLAKLPGAVTAPTDTDGGAIVSAQTLIGTFNLASDTDMFQFTAAAGDRVVITATGTPAGVYPEIYLYPPGSGESEASAIGAGGSKRLDYQLQQTGTYTILMQENGLNTAGDYAISLAKLPGAVTSPTDTNGGAIVSAQTLIGTFNLDSDTDMFQFTATANDRVVITTTGTTTGVYPEIYLYPPGSGGSEASAVGAGGSKRLDCQLQQTGTYTILMQDNGLNTAGDYAISLAKLPGAVTSPTDTNGGAIVSAQTLTGTFNLASDTDMFQFTAAAGDRVVITATGTTTGVYPEIYLYPPGSGESEASAVGAGGSKRLEHLLQDSGTYTILLQDNGLNTAGIFDVSLEKNPPNPGPGVYELYPYEGTSTNEFIGYLGWDPVPGATGYDVHFGEDVIAPLVKIGDNISAPFLALPDMAPLTVYYWQVVAHTPSGDIPGPIQWFKTGIFDCEGDFGHSGSVDSSDLAFFTPGFGRSDCNSGPPCSGDFDLDLDVDGTDIANFMRDYGRINCPIVQLAESFTAAGPPTGWTSGGSGTWTSTDGVYRMTGQKPTGGAFSFSYYASVFNDFTFQAEVNQVQGGLNSGSGLLFRGDGTLNNVYIFQIMPNGTYSVDKRSGGIGSPLVPSTYSSTINTGLNAVNTLKVASHGATMQFYINDKLVNVVEDEEFDSGRVGLYAWDDSAVTTEVHFDDAEAYWISIP